jgi:hypothetical protein
VFALMDGAHSEAIAAKRVFARNEFIAKRRSFIGP